MQFVAADHIFNLCCFNCLNCTRGYGRRWASAPFFAPSTEGAVCQVHARLRCALQDPCPCPGHVQLSTHIHIRMSNGIDWRAGGDLGIALMQRRPVSLGCIQASLINNFQSDQKSHLILDLNCLDGRWSSAASPHLHRSSDHCYPCLLLSFHYCYFMHHIHSPTRASCLAKISHAAGKIIHGKKSSADIWTSDRKNGRNAILLIQIRCDINLFLCFGDDLFVPPPPVRPLSLSEP